MSQRCPLTLLYQNGPLVVLATRGRRHLCTTWRVWSFKLTTCRSLMLPAKRMAPALERLPMHRCMRHPAPHKHPPPPVCANAWPHSAHARQLQVLYKVYLADAAKLKQLTQSQQNTGQPTLAEMLDAGNVIIEAPFQVRRRPMLAL
jgi:hypothetical protein